MLSPLPLNYGGRFFMKKAFHGGTNFVGKIYGGGGILNGGTNDQIMMPRGEESFINDKCMI